MKTSEINDNQRKRWKKRGTIPLQVLQTLWTYGVRVESDPPKTGMGFMCFFELLWKFIHSCPDKETSAEALNLYQNTVKLRSYPDCLKRI